MLGLTKPGESNQPDAFISLEDLSAIHGCTDLVADTAEVPFRCEESSYVPETKR